MKHLLLCLLLPCISFAQNPAQNQIHQWEQQAKNITIIRDNWGIPHIYGNTDADAVFGLLYAQCEDDFKRVEMNYIEKLGRLSEVNGDADLYNDLLIRLLIDTTEAKADYKKAEPWLRTLLNAYADGINYYILKHPDVKPLLIKKFQPWYPLLWTDGSIGAINTAGISTIDLKNFYANDTASIGLAKPKEENLSGSNGFAIGPSKSASGNAMLYINPHVTFYFRPEVHAVSNEGLNVYGAVTWGQFFIYQGFNEHCGWMHTSSDVDVADLYAEKIIKSKNGFSYAYNNKVLAVKEKMIAIQILQDGKIRSKMFKTYFTQHGPVMAKRNGQWLALKSYNRSMTSLIQSWKRTKANGFEAYKKVMDLKGNTSNNTVFADDKGNIAYWHGNFVPVRDKTLNWAKPVDGSKSATEWQGLHKVEDIVHVYNPETGWIQNCNSTPFTAAGANSPKKENYPFYMSPDGENFRGINAVKVLSNESSLTLDKLIAAGYDTYLSAFEKLVPALLQAYDKLADDSIHHQLVEPIGILKSWDFRCGESSVATTLAVEWGQKLLPKIIASGDEDEYQYVDQVTKTDRFISKAIPADLIAPLKEVLDELSGKFGTWRMPWGDINRFQRISSDINQKFSDDKPSLPVAFTSSAWGMLPSYATQYFPGIKKRYGTGGNSFICAVEFGKKVKAKSLLAGGESGDPLSKHFIDQAEMYTKGKFKDVLFYKEDVMKHVERKYHPGE